MIRDKLQNYEQKDQRIIKTSNSFHRPYKPAEIRVK